MTALVRFWGTRGSIPTPGDKTRHYGGNTSCVTVEKDGVLFVLDAGTGLRELGLELAERDEPLEAHLLFSHTHWDHIQGFPFFQPAYKTNTRLNVYEIEREHPRFTQLLLGQMRSEYFPFEFSALGSQIVSRSFIQDMTTVDGVRLSVMRQHHPGGSFGHRLEFSGERVVYATDNELDLALLAPDEAVEHPERLRRLPQKLLEFAEGAALLIADAQYSDEEYATHRGWGHSRITTAVDFAIEAKVRRLALFHHDPLHGDREIDHLVALARGRAASLGGQLEVFAAREGASLSIP